MPTIRVRVSHLAACLLVLCVVIPVRAQEENAEQPQIDSPLAVEPTTPAEHFDAALLMMQLARPEMARHYLEKLLEMDPDDETLMQIRETYGTNTILQLARVEEAKAAASKLLDRLNQAVQSKISAPGYVRSILPKLVGSAREKAEALTELQNLGPAAIGPMLSSLMANDIVDRGTLVYTMTRLGEDVVPPLVGALESSDELIRTTAAEVLGWVGTEAELIWLWHPAFTENEPDGVRHAALAALARLSYGDPQHAARVSSYGVDRRMLEVARSMLASEYEWPMSFGDRDDVSVWSWDDASGTVNEHVVSRDHAAIFLAERLAREVTELAPRNTDAPVVLLTALLTRDMEQAGWDQPIPIGPGSAHDLAMAAGPDVCESVLEFSLDNAIPGAAASSVQALALNGSESLLHSSSSPIIRALNAPSARIQFAAAVAILQWEPRRGFSGATRIVEILGRAINADSKANSVVVDPNESRGTLTASLFQEIGFDSSLDTTGQAGFTRAAMRGDVELAVLHPTTIRWDLDQTVNNLRADARTQNLPIVIYGPANSRARYERVLTRYPNINYINQQASSILVIQQLKPILAQVSPPALTQAQRAAQIEDAAFWLRRIATRHEGVFDLSPIEESLLAAVSKPEIAEDVLVILGAIGRPSVQRRYLTVVNNPTQTDDLRQMAALQLGFHVQRFGMLLSESEVSDLRGAWDSEQAPGVRTALASVIGTMRPTSAAARQEILGFPRSAAPVGSDAAASPIE